MITIPGALSRRKLILSAAAAGAMAKAVSAQTPEASHVDTSTQYLLAGVALDGNPDLLIGVENYDAGLNHLSSLQVEDGVVSMIQTGRSGVVQIVTMFGGVIVDINSGVVVSVDWDIADPGYFFPAPPDPGVDLSENYVLAQTFEHDKVLLIDLENFTGTDITEHVANEGLDIVTMVPDIPAEGSIGGIWTGDNVHLIDFEDPSTAEPLKGDDPEWYSTTLQLSFDGKWGIFTTYDPKTRGEDGHCYLQNLESGEFSKIIDGDVWSTGFFIPGDPEHFLAVVPESGLEYRAISSAAEQGKKIADVGFEGSRNYWLNGGKILLYGHRNSDDAPRNWIRVDMETMEVTELPELEGQRPWWPKLAKTAPKYLLFCEDTYKNMKHTLRGFDVETGEVWTAVEDIYLETLSGITGSADGRWYTASTPNRGANIGVWVIDMESKNVHKLAETDGRYPEYGAVSPDGGTVAITYLEQPAGTRYTVTASTDSPEDSAKLTDALVIGWSL